MKTAKFKLLQPKKRLLSTSANVLKVCSPSYHNRMSYSELYKINKRASPEEMCNYKHAIFLHKHFNMVLPLGDWIDLNFQQTFSTRSSTFHFVKTNRFKVGHNLISNRLNILNN